jgi:hypothetical protein
VKPRSAASVVSGVVAGRTLLLNLQTGTYLSLSASGTRLWELRQAHGDAGAVRLASAEYGVPEEVVRADLRRMLTLVDTLRAKRRPPHWSRRRVPSLRRIAAVPLGDWPSLALTICLATAVELGLRATPLPRLTTLTGISLAFGVDVDGDPGGRRRLPAGALTEAQQRRVRATERVYAVWPLGDTCLRRALVLGCHLRREHPRLRIGVGPPPPGISPPPPVASTAEVHADRTPSIAAHAWLETSAVTLLAIDGFESLTVVGPARRP